MRLAPGDPDSVEIRFFDDDGRDIDEGDAAQDRAAAVPRGLPAGVRAATSATSCSRPARSSSTPPRSSESSTSTGCASAGFKVVLDYSFGAASIVMPNVLAKLGAEVLAVNPFASTAAATSTDEPRDAQVERIGDLVRASGSDLGFVIDPDGETGDRRRRRRPRRSSPSRRCSRSSRSSRRRVPSARASRSRCRSRREAERIAERARRRDRVDEAVGRAASWRSRRAARSTFAASHDGGFIWPDFLPAYDAAATLVKLLDLLAAVDRPLSTVVRRRCPTSHVAHETVADAVGAQGRGDARDGRAGEGARDVVLVDGVKIDRRRTAGRSCCPTPRTPSPTCGPRPAATSTRASSPQEYAQRIRQIAALTAASLRSAPMNFPEELRYSAEHEWVRVDGVRARIGITDFAQDALGDVVFVQLPDVGLDGRRGRELRRDRVDQVGVRDLRAGHRARSSR